MAPKKKIHELPKAVAELVEGCKCDGEVTKKRLIEAWHDAGTQLK